MLTKDRNTPRRQNLELSIPMAASAVIKAGALVVTNAGYAEKGTTDTGLVFMGMAIEAQDNSSGVNGAKSILVRRGEAFAFKNSSTDPIAQADFGATCYIEDDETVAKTNGTNTRSAAGQIVGIEGNLVWVAA